MTQEDDCILVFCAHGCLMFSVSFLFSCGADSEPWNLDRVDGRGGAADQGPLQAGARAAVPRVREQGAPGRRRRRRARRQGGEPGLGEHLLRAPPPGVQPRRAPRPRRRVPARDEAVRRRAGGAGGAAAGPAVREPRPGEGLPRAPSAGPERAPRPSPPRSAATRRARARTS